MFQRIEQNFRLILPYIHPEGHRKGADAMRTYQRTRVDNRTLGQLAEDFKESVSGSKELIDLTLSDLVAARNDLVHHFYRNERFSFLDEDGLKDALGYLDEQQRSVRVWDEISSAHAVAVLTILIDQSSDLAAEFGQHRDRLVALWPDWMQVLKSQA